MASTTSPLKEADTSGIEVPVCSKCDLFPRCRWVVSVVSPTNRLCHAVQLEHRPLYLPHARRRLGLFLLGHPSCLPLSFSIGRNDTQHRPLLDLCPLEVDHHDVL